MTSDTERYKKYLQSMARGHREGYRSDLRTMDGQLVLRQMAGLFELAARQPARTDSGLVQLQAIFRKARM